nr:DUF2220 family protein [uncultured Acetatifactor sp.]
MKKIPLEQLLGESRTDDYQAQYDYVLAQMEAQRIRPVKSSPLNGKKPALHLYYWAEEEKPDYHEELEELNFGMDPVLCTDYYLRHPEVYRSEARWVRMLNRYFLERREQKAGWGQPERVSLNERSFQIWGREKFLQKEQGRRILAHCGIRLEQLSVYETTEPLAYYSCSRKAPQTLLILENKDTFYSMRRFLGVMDGITRNAAVCRQTIFGVEIGTVIYGAGKGILRSFEDFRFCVEPYMNDSRNQIFYFGDLDYEGIGIYERLEGLFETVRPFAEAYEKMLEKARAFGLDLLPEASEKQNRNLSGRFFRHFSEETRKRMRQILESGKYIPQEIINIADFGEAGQNCGEGE